jgi:hypothetical protein
MSNLPFGYFRMFCPRKSNPCEMCVILVFSGRERQSALLQKGLDQWLDLVFQQLSRVTGDHKVIGIAHQTDFGANPFASNLAAEELLH